MPMLEVQGLVKIYGRRRVVDGVDFEVGAGEIVGLLGPNGAGKTTSFRMTCGMIEPNAGKVILNDIDVTRWPMYRRARDGGMGYLAQESSVFRKLTVEQNLLGMMEMLGHRPPHAPPPLRRTARTVRHRQAAQEPGHFALGRRAAAAGNRPLPGLRPEAHSARRAVHGHRPGDDRQHPGDHPRLRAAGISILITDHQVRETLQITDRSYVIASGKVLTDGRPDDVLQNPEARKHYFGEGIEIGRPGPPAPHGVADSWRSRLRRASSQR